MNQFLACCTRSSILALAAFALPCTLMAQTQDEEVREKHSRLQIGGYGEAVYSRQFYSNDPTRYTNPGASKNKDAKEGHFDLPHVVVYLGYDFGKGWSVGSEIEFEHGGTGGAYEKEYFEAQEYEQETEKGGEVELEQFWIQKSIFPQLNIKAGHIVVPVGYTNAHHEPLNFFTVYRPEGEATIFPCTWHQTGLSVWGRHNFTEKFGIRYEAQILAGLNSQSFSTENWIQGGHTSPFEFDPGSRLGGAARIDLYIPNGPRLGFSGYYGRSVNNGYNKVDGKDFQAKGTVLIGSFDASYEGYGLIARANFDYGHLGDAWEVNSIAQNQTGNTSPYSRSFVGDQAIAYGIEAGYDLFRFSPKLRRAKQQLYVFGRYEYYDSYRPASRTIEQNGVTVKQQQIDQPWTERNRLAVGINYKPIKEIVIKAEFSKRFLKSQYNDEPAISIGVAYAGFFTK